ncbi:uncharacterized protein DNG_04545 [Cephalotrichum gorgonifer]|uniref:Heterokaryon incompatibility domain-containing protein n=1 Tax=Cephalotrichum gorgonifer TaxID=2041049 RepID=A0AAE8MZ59_9PEZI|nr:uncharacterized protein DNG_04545 [Cephalotrichum gorgonifer]
MLGCWICAKFAAWLDAKEPDLLAKWRIQPLQVEYSEVGGVGFVSSTEEIIFLMGVGPPGRGQDDYCVVSLSIISSQEHTIITSQRLSRILDDLTLAKTWLDRYRAEHKGCKDESQPWYPTRLLDLEPGGRTIKLVITANVLPTGPYMTLSHRWSDERYTKLESSTIGQLQKRIEVLHLPKSFQDAIRIARHLGVRYLWIDSLCIKQDKGDLSDWMVESQKMSRVYSSACMNISATRSADGTESLLDKSCWAAKHPTQIQLDNADGSPREYSIIDGDLWEDEIEQAPLNSRGWVFQERYLARRIVHFGVTQLGWECRQSRALGMLPHGLPASLGVPSSKRRMIGSDAAAPSISSPGSGNTKFAEEWSDLMNQYSRCEFTYSKDKLVALEGTAANTLETRDNDAYAAGMWKSSALYDLPWWRDDNFRGQYPITSTALRAPSWSWASVDGEVNFPLLHGSYSSLRESYSAVKGISSETTVDNTNVVTTGTLEMECMCLPITLNVEENEVTSFTTAGLLFSAEDKMLGVSIYLDCPAEPKELVVCGQELSFVPLFATTHTLFGLLLMLRTRSKEFQRIGAIDIPIMEEGIPGAALQQEGLFVTESAAPAQFRGSRLGVMSQIWKKQALELRRHLSHSSSSRELIRIS